MGKIKPGFLREDGKVFLNYKKGKENWGTQSDYENIKIWWRNYRLKRKAYVIKNYKIGYYSEEKKLYFIRTSGSLSEIWGTKDELDSYRAKKRSMKLKYFEKMKSVKEQSKKMREITRSRGDIDPILNLIFWKYNSLNGNEIWIRPEKFVLFKQTEKTGREKRRKFLAI